VDGAQDIQGAYISIPKNPPQLHVSAGLYYIVCEHERNWKFLDNHNGMVYNVDTTLNKQHGLLWVGPQFTNIQWRLVAAGGNSFNIVNEDQEKHLDGNIDQGQTVKLWVGPGGVSDQGTAPQFIQWKFFRGIGNNNYFVLNVGKQMWLDSNGMGLWRGGDVNDRGTHPQNITWKLVPC
jgi:hypothetical protein